MLMNIENPPILLFIKVDSAELFLYVANLLRVSTIAYFMW